MESQKETFTLKGNNIQAEGNLIDEGFVVFKGSTAKLDTDVYRFIEDYIFSSPSTAGGVILG